LKWIETSIFQPGDSPKQGVLLPRSFFEAEKRGDGGVSAAFGQRSGEANCPRESGDLNHGKFFIDAMVLDLTIIAWCCINGGPNHLLALAMKAARLRGL